jgi:hypothetical protein
MTKKFLHIGIGRCSNITLINNIYPIISQHCSYKFYTSDDYIQNKIDINYEKMKLGIDVDENIKIKEDIIVCDERLVSWNPINWESYANSNLKMFGSETTVLITLRDPLDYLNSMYKNQCLVSGNLMTPDEYFALNKNYNIHSKKIFNLEHFSYNRLKKIYEDRFKEVIFLDYKNIENMNFFQKYFNLNNDVKDKLIVAYKNSIPNKSFGSEFTNKLTLKLYGLLKLISLIFNLNFIRKNFKNFKASSNKKKIKNELMLELTLMQIKEMNKHDIKLNFYRSFVNIIKWSKLMFFIEKYFKNNKKFQIKINNDEKNCIILKCKKEYLDIISR